MSKNVPSNITLDDGFIEITINNDPNRVIKWNPTDASFIDRFYKFIEFSETIQERLSALSNELPNDDTDGATDNYGEVGAKITKIGQDVANELDKTFGAEVSKAAFLGVNPISPSANNGQFLFVNLVSALEPVITKSFDDAKVAREKYTEGFRNRAERRANQQ